MTAVDQMMCLARLPKTRCHAHHCALHEPIVPLFGCLLLLLERSLEYLQCFVKDKSLPTGIEKCSKASGRSAYSDKYSAS
jgi:hypothetical protein